MGFVRVEKRGSNGTQYFYLCTYNPKTRNVNKRYLGPAHSLEAQKNANFYIWINSLSKQRVKKLREESLATEKYGPTFHTSLERVLELGKQARQY
ncbi:hypothetical protein A3K80_02035 [Candidatus Bathyarchaeota archaeon RBG_13_38_9]|nr:MAG: hypothetical protein A3K80_02035 [Candidatus Bathyarchaeota archaeon RBG_13_38_9]